VNLSFAWVLGQRQRNAQPSSALTFVTARSYYLTATQHSMVLLSCSARRKEYRCTMSHEFFKTQGKHKANMVDRILIGNAEVYVPTQRPDTNCASLITVVSLCNVSCSVSSFNQRAVAACVAAESGLYISLQSTCAVQSRFGN
jgi:hypothetical protein